MNKRILLSISAIIVLGLAFVSSTAIAQQQSLKEQLVGTWTVVSRVNTLPNGTKRPISNAKGILFFDAGGRYAVVLGRGDRPKFKSANQPTTEELAAATSDFFAANFGTWSVNEADKTLTLRYDGALRPNNEGTDVKTSVSLAGDELKLSNSTSTSGGTTIETVFRRAK
jgi:Lipocalin-like domain